MTAQECLKYIVKELHTVVFSTVDEKGYPVTCAIDMMDGDESSLYFLTARGKAVLQSPESQQTYCVYRPPGKRYPFQYSGFRTGRGKRTGQQSGRLVSEKFLYV